MHGILGMILDHPAFEFPLDHTDGLVHAGYDLQLVLGVDAPRTVDARREDAVVESGICFHCESGQRQQIDAVAFFEGVEIAVAQSYAQHVGDACVVACECSHPEYVVIAPLDVEVVVVADRVHDNMRSRTAVVDVADDMQTVDGQALDEVTHRYDECVGPAGRDDGRDDLVEVGVFVGIGLGLVEQFLDYVAEVFGERLVDLGAGVLRRYALTDLYQAVEGDLIPFAHVGLLGFDEFELFLRIVDQGAEVFFLRLAQAVAEYFVDFALDCSGSVFQHVLERLVFAVDVCQKMLCAFWKV